MEIRSARHVVVLARYLSFTRAADELGLTQSALSRSVQQIEAVAKVRLFDRERGGGVRLTALGRTFVEHATELLRRADELQQLLHRASTGKQQKVAFGIGRQPGAALLVKVVADEQKVSPELQMRVFVRSPEALLRLLKEGEVEFFVSLSTMLPPKEDVDASRIGRIRLTYLVRPDHPLLTASARHDLADFPWIMSSNLHDASLALGSGHRLSREPQIMLEDMGSAARIAEQTDLIWLTSTYAAVREVQEGRLCEIPRPPSDGETMPFEVLFYRLRGGTLSPAAERLHARFREAARFLDSEM